VSDYGSLVGDYKNPILQPWAADVVKKKGELSLAGITFPSPSNTCWPEPVPYLFKHAAMRCSYRTSRPTVGGGASRRTNMTLSSRLQRNLPATLITRINPGPIGRSPFAACFDQKSGLSAVGRCASFSEK
jgi:hypothetical protein